MALTIGSLLAGRYEITAPIAVGGMGEVWKARDRVLDRDVAAKVLKSEYTDDPSFLARFRNEARHTAGLTHQNIASVYDYGETEQNGQQLAFLVMELVDGQPLVTILHEEGKLPVDWTLHVLGQSADGLSAAHRAGVVHRDIKPGNLLVRPDGVVKLTDFGIAQARDATPLTRTGMVVGTAQYLSPEQAQGMEVTAASDVYSLGVVAYECLSGARPFDGASQVAIALAHINRPPPPLPFEIPPAVRLLVERALAKDAADRFPDGGAFADAIRRVAAGGTLAATGRPGPATTPAPIVGGFADGRTQVLPATGPGAMSAATAMTGAALPAAMASGLSPAMARTGTAGAMPPLQADPDGDWLTDGESAFPPEDGGRNRWVWVAAALVLLLLLAGGIYFLLFAGGKGGSGNGAGSSSASNSTASPTGIFLDPTAFIGKPADQVQTTLTNAGLTVTQQTATRAMLVALGRSLNPGDVAGLAPSGVQAAPGTPVVLYVADHGFAPDNGQSSSAPPSTSAARTTASTAPSTTAPTTTAPTTSVSATPTLTTAATTSAAGSSAPPATDPAATSP